MSKPFFRAEVIYSEDMNPGRRVSEKTGRVWSLYRVHCVVEIGDGERRVCQLINDTPVAPGPYQIGIGIAERDGRTVFQPSGFFRVPAPQQAGAKAAA